MDYNRTFSYELPTKIDFGVGISERVEGCGGSKVLLVVDPGVLTAGVADKVTNAMKEATMPHVLFSDIEPEPKARSIVEGVEEERLYDLAKAGMATANVPVNPRAPTVDDLVGIMRRCMGNADGR